jgi:hypothetical protein
MPGVLALGMQGVRGDHAARQIQWLQQRRELGDLIGFAVHGPLRKDGPGLLIDGGQQVRGLPVAGAMPGAAQGLAVHGHRPAPAAAADSCGAGQPAGHGSVQLAGVHRLQDPADSRLARWLEPAFQRIEPDTQRGQHPRRGIGDPLPDRRQRPRTSQHGRHRGQQDRRQRMANAARVARIRNQGQELPQARALGRQRPAARRMCQLLQGTTDQR